MNWAGVAPEIRQKWDKLVADLAKLESLAVAFSGGVDSALVAAAARQALGKQMVAVFIHSPVELEEALISARRTAQEADFELVVIDYNDLELEEFRANLVDRCYTCKLNRFGRLVEYARVHGYAALAEGSNADDVGQYRPGSRAVEELAVLSPLKDAGLHKFEIRALAQGMGLSVWDRPSAPCLATRFPYGSTITAKGLAQVGQAEMILKRMGFRNVRVRHHQQLASIEVAQDQIEQLIQQRDAIAHAFSGIGFSHTAVDLQGYRSGSLDEGINKP